MNLFEIVVVLVVIAAFFVWRKLKTKDAPPKTEPDGQSEQEEMQVCAAQREYAENRGREGEEKVRSILLTLPKSEYIVLSDVLLPTVGGTTQLDHVVISEYGIFVIEVKNYQGQIYGGKTGEEWTNYLNGKEYKIRNPLLQNYAHAKAVARVLKTSTANIFPLTVFSGSAVLKIQNHQQVIYEYSLLPTIRMHRDRVFTPQQMEYYARIIDEAIEETPETRSAHIQYVKEVISQKNEEISKGLCPRCSGQLVLRRGKYGDFYGCSNYPNCKYTKEL